MGKTEPRPQPQTSLLNCFPCFLDAYAHFFSISMITVYIIFDYVLHLTHIFSFQHWSCSHHLQFLCIHVVWLTSLVAITRYLSYVLFQIKLKIPWRSEWLPTPVFSPGEFHGQRSLAGCSPWDGKELDTTERLTPWLSHCWEGAMCEVLCSALGVQRGMVYLTVSPLRSGTFRSSLSGGGNP